jgi:transposase
VKKALPEEAKDKEIEIWFQDEARVGQQGTLTRVWAKKGSRPRRKRDKRFKSMHIFGAVCPKRGATAALVTPYVDQEAMVLHLIEISKEVAVESHAIVILDRAGWHRAKKLKIPSNITLVYLPPYSPELNSIENVWAYLRANRLSHCVFENEDEIMQACCEAWNFFTEDKSIVQSITTREWTQVNT